MEKWKEKRPSLKSIKILLLVITIGIIIAGYSASSLITFSLLFITERISFSEPNKLILIIEFGFIILGFPLIIYFIKKMIDVNIIFEEKRSE